jgi:hypothetical protein
MCIFYTYSLIFALSKTDNSNFFIWQAIVRGRPILRVAFLFKPDTGYKFLVTGFKYKLQVTSFWLQVCEDVSSPFSLGISRA